MANSIKRIQSGSTKNSWEWDSNDILLGQASQDKTFYDIRISYEGTAPTIDVYLEGNEIVTGQALTGLGNDVGEYSLPTNNRRGKRLNFNVYSGSASTIVNDISIIYRVRSQR